MATIPRAISLLDAAAGGAIVISVASCLATVSLDELDEGSGATGAGGGAPGGAGGSGLLAACDEGFLDCDGDLDNGCEVDPASDAAHCGACGAACTAEANQTPFCEEGECGASCDGAYLNCDQSPDNGCETDGDSDLAHCGECDLECGIAQADPVCTGGECILNCVPGWGDCDADVESGCETNLGTTDAHCGGCGVGCSVGGCVGGLCTLASLQSGLSDLAVDASNVYVTSSDGDVTQIPKNGGEPAVIATDPVDAMAIAVNDAHVYWTSWDGGTIRRVDIGGGNETPLVSGMTNPIAVALDDTHLYWLNGVPSGSTGSVHRAPLAGAPVDDLAPLQPWPNDLRIDTTHVYWANANAGSVNRMPLGGGAPQPLANGQSGLRHIALDTTNVYWATSTGILKAAKGGGVPVPLGNATYPMELEVDAIHVYFTNWDGDQLLKVPIEGGDVVTVVPGQSTTTALALDDDAVYFLRPNSGQVMKVVK